MTDKCRTCLHKRIHINLYAEFSHCEQDNAPLDDRSQCPFYEPTKAESVKRDNAVRVFEKIAQEYWCALIHPTNNLLNFHHAGTLFEVGTDWILVKNKQNCAFAMLDGVIHLTYTTRNGIGNLHIVSGTVTDGQLRVINETNIGINEQKVWV